MATENKTRRRSPPTKLAEDAPFLTLRVRGPGVRSGRIPVPDLIRICNEAQNAVKRQAEALEGRKTRHPGPTSQAIQTECTLELVAIGKGSTKLEFGFAKPQLPLPFEGFGFGFQVVGELASSIKSLGNGNRKEIDGGVLESLYSLGAVMDSYRISEIEWITPKRGTQPKVVAPINRIVKERITSRLSLPRTAHMAVDGVLDMADFKPRDRKCRIDPPVGASIMCSFGVDQEAEVYRLLRKPVRVSGDAVLQPYSSRVDSMRIDTIRELPSLALGKGNFFAETSIIELAAAQKVGPISDLSKLAGGFPPDEDVDEFLREIYEARK